MSDYFNSLFDSLPDNDSAKIITSSKKKKVKNNFDFEEFAMNDPQLAQIRQDNTFVDSPEIMSIDEKENQRLISLENERTKVGEAVLNRIQTGRTADIARTPMNTFMAGLESLSAPAAAGIEAIKGMTGSKGGADFKQALPSFLGNEYFPGQYKGQDLSITGAISEDFQKNYPITSAITDFGLSIAAGSAASKGAKLSKQSKFKSEIDWAKWNPDTPKQKVLMDDYLEVEKRTKADGTWMKNPDGTPFVGSSPAAKELSDAGVNMTPEEAVKAQFVQQQSKAFKEAFNNPVLDKKGNIQINYHGSSSAFDFFDPLKFYSGKFGKGIYTSPVKEKILKTYADPSKNRSKKIKQITSPNTKSSDNLYSLYINSKNTGNLDELNEAGKYYGNIRNYGKTKDDFLSLEEWKKENADILKANTFLKNDNDIKQFLRTNKQTVKETFEPVLPQYDFLQILDRKIPEQVTPYSNLMKSALGNVGTFDMTNPNIYKGLAGAAATGALLSDEEVRNNPETALAAGMFFTPFRFGKKKVSNKIIKDKDFEKGVIPSYFENVAEDFGNIKKQLNVDLEKIHYSNDIEDLSKSVDSINKRIAKEKTELHQKYVDFFQNDKIMQDNISLMKSKDIDYGSPKYLELEEIVKNRATEYANKIGYNPYEKTSNVSLNKQSNNPKKHFYKSKPSINDLKSFKYGGMVNGPKDPPPTDPPYKNPWVPSITTSTARGGKLKGDNLRGKTLNQRLYESITPIGYDWKHALKEFKAGKRLPFMWDGEMTSFEDFDKMDRWRDPVTGKLGWYGEHVKEASDDHSNYYFNQEQKYDTFYPSKYKPSTNTGEDVEYMQFEYDDDIFDEAIEYGMFDKKVKVGTNKQVTDSAAGGFTLKDYTLSRGSDERGDYISYYDKVDFAPSVMGMKIPVEKFVGKPYDFYGRMYYTKDEEGKVKRVFPKDPKKKEFSMKDFLSPENISKSMSKPQIDNVKTNLPTFKYGGKVKKKDCNCKNKH